MTTKPGRYGDGRGLYLVVSDTGARKWVFRFTFSGRVTEMGLGPANDVSLAQAREKADSARRLVAVGVNPIDAKREAAKARIAKPTFGQVADELIASKSSEWRNAKHHGQWKQTLEQYAAALRSMPVDEIDTAAVLAVLQPVWQSAPETASRMRGRIEAVLNAAKARGLRTGENPAAWRGHLDHLLPRRQKLSRSHHAAMPYDEVPAFIGHLREQQYQSIAALALEFCILTAARSGEVLGAQWSEIELDGRVWTIPAVRLKAGREHRVPLSGRALVILEELAKAKCGDLVFPGRRRSQPFGEGVLLAVLRRMKADGLTVHGFRSSFRDWCGEATSFPREIAEAALAHVSGDSTERAYRRGDALEKRRALMESWAGFCEPGAGGNVVPMTRRTDVVAN